MNDSRNGILIPRFSTSRVRRLHATNAKQRSEETMPNSSIHSSLVSPFEFLIFLLISFSHSYKSREILTEFCRPVLKSSFILTFPTAWHSVCWPSSPHLEGEAWGRGISGWKRWSPLKKWVIWQVTVSLWSWSEDGTSFP